MSETGIPMNSELAKQPQSSEHADAPGVQLKARREAMGWTIEHVAEQLKLAPRQVAALELGDAAGLPNKAVVRGFIRAYAKVVKLDAAPLVAMIEVNTMSSAPPNPMRSDISARFAESRFPSLTPRSWMPKRWVIGIVVVAFAVAALAAWKVGLISPSMLMHAPAGAATIVPAQADPVLPKPVLETPPPAAALPAAAAASGVPALPAVPAVPLISVLPTAAASSSKLVPASSANAAVSENALVLTVNADSWVELRRVGAAPLIARLLKAGSSERFNITEQMLLIVGKPAAVQASLRGEPLLLPAAAAGQSSRLSIK